MAYSEELAFRIRHRLEHIPNIEEKRMMGGLVFMYNDKMCLGIVKDDMMCRVDPAIHDELVEKPGCRTMDFGTRPMKGYILIDDTGMRTQKQFDYWINLALEFNKHAKASQRKKISAAKKPPAAKKT